MKDIKIHQSYKCHILEPDVTLSSSTTAPVFIKKAEKTMIILADIQVNAKRDGLKSDHGTYTTRAYIEVLDGNITVDAGGDALSAKTDVLITKGTFKLTSGGGSSVAKNANLSAKGVKGLVSVIIDGGTFTIGAADDGIHTNGLYPDGNYSPGTQ